MTASAAPDRSCAASARVDAAPATATVTATAAPARGDAASTIVPAAAPTVPASGLSGHLRLFGVDFTSAPRRAKPITIAAGVRDADRLHVTGIDACARFDAFEAWLATPGPWLAGFDFPFGLPRELVLALGWPCTEADGDDAWTRLVRHLERTPRAQMVAAFRAFCDARPPGGKFAHRATDRPAGSSPSMKWVNPPVAFMLQAGAPRLLAAGVSVPGLHAGDPLRVALETYPGALARAVLGRDSYKSDDPRKATPQRTRHRAALVDALARGAHPLGIVVSMSGEERARCIDDAGADRLDAVLCLVQAAWADQRRAANFGLPDVIDPVEGWIAGIPDAA